MGSSFLGVYDLPAIDGSQTLRGHYRQQTPVFAERARFKYSSTAEESTRRLQTHDFRFLRHPSLSPFTEVFQDWHDTFAFLR
jgi:hypothetical protein